MSRMAVSWLARGALGAACAMAPGSLVLAMQSGCGLFGGGPSAVGQGQQYESGDPAYDEFFATLYELQVGMNKAPDDEKKVRGALAEEVGVEDDSGASLISKGVKKAAEKLAVEGTGLKPDVKGEDGDDPDDVNVSIGVAGKELEGRNKEFVKALEKALEGEAQLAAHMKKAKKKIDKLRAALPGLQANSDATFRKSTGKKSEVKKNLADAEQLIPLMLTRGEEVAGTAQKFIEAIVEAATTDKGQFNAPPPPPEAVELDAGAKDKDKDKGKDKGKKGESGSKPPPPPSDFEP